MLVALVIVVLLVAIIVEFDYGTRAALTSAGTFRDGTQATYLAKSGVRAAQALLKEDAKYPDRYKDLKTQPCLVPVPLPVPVGTASATICDESAKLNIDLLQKPTDYQKSVFQRLFQVLEIDPSLVEAIKDWLDADDFTEGLYGAEAGYYERLTPPYTCKNGPLDSISELRLIKGITHEVYRKLTTGCGGKPCVTVAPTDKVNMNTVSVEVCRALHEDLVDNEDLCRELVEHRPIENIDSDGEFPAGWGGVGGGTAGGTGIRFELKSRNMITISSSYFSIQARGEVHETQRIVEAVVKRQGQNVALMSWRLE